MVEDTQHPPAEGEPHGKGRARSIALLGLFCLALLTVWLVPTFPGVTENRTAARFPTLSLSTAIHQSTYAQIDAAIRDRLNAKSYVARGIGALSVDLLGASPNQAVFLGSDKQRFYTEDLTNPCRISATALRQMGNNVAIRANQFKQAGKYLLFVIAPDKSSIRQSELGWLSMSLLHCALPEIEYFQDLSRRGTVPLLTLWEAVGETDKVSSGAFLFTDSHWNWMGASTMTRAVLERLVADSEAPASILEDINDLTIGPDRKGLGDLDVLMGLEARETSPILTFERPGVSTNRTSDISPSGRAETRWTSSSPTRALVPGRTLIYGDSFMGFVESQLPQFFEDVTFAHVNDRSAPGQLVREGHFDRVIVERVQRYASLDLAVELAAGLN